MQHGFLPGSYRSLGSFFMRVSFLSWNLGLLERSDEAPHSWQMEHTEAAVREKVLDLAPDVVLLQELPRLVPYVETHGMIPANPESHSGNLATLVRLDLLEQCSAPEIVDGCGILITIGDLTLVNVHLAPGKGQVAQRLEQLARVVEASPTPRLLIAGDTNTRRAEEEALADAGLTGERPPKPTWNSRRNRFRADGPEFSAYFTRWFGTDGVEVASVQVHDAPTRSDDHSFFLSDHFALSGTIVSA